MLIEATIATCVVFAFILYLLLSINELKSSNKQLADDVKFLKNLNISARLKNLKRELNQLNKVPSKNDNLNNSNEKVPSSQKEGKPKRKYWGYRNKANKVPVEKEPESESSYQEENRKFWSDFLSDEVTEKTEKTEDN